jgi:hypothetical protein
MICVLNLRTDGGAPNEDFSSPWSKLLIMTALVYQTK